MSIDSTLRRRAIPLLVGLIVEALVGSLLSNTNPYNLAYLGTHIGLALLIVVFSGYALILSLRRSKASARAAAGLTFITTLGATVSGTVFLLGGSSPIALDAMQALAVVAILGAILLMVFGAVPSPRPTA
ncbi:MAG: hypothetical protein ACRECT_05905 [Thermoplasmata archaeon]